MFFRLLNVEERTNKKEFNCNVQEPENISESNQKRSEDEKIQE
jgi:hypothetical protein